MNLKELVKDIEKCGYECKSGNLLKDKNWVDLREKVFRINEIVWSLRNGNFSDYEEAMKEIDNIFSIKDFDCCYTNQDEFYD